MSDWTPIAEVENYGFTVEYETDWLPGATGSYRDARHIYTGGYRVFLPHSCDTWDIVGAAHDNTEISKAEAVTQLEGFIFQAQQALEELKAMPDIAAGSPAPEEI